MEKKYYIYRHIRLDNNMPFYIGRGTYQKTRKYTRAFCYYGRNSLWNRISSKHGYRVEIVFESDDFNLVCYKEKYFIKLYGKISDNTGILSNLTDGGERESGFKFTQEIKDKISKANKGKTHSIESKKKMSLYRKGIKKSESHKIKIGKKQIGGLNHRAKIVLDLHTGIYYDCVKDAFNSYNFNFHIKSLGKKLNGRLVNNTNLTFV